MALECDGYGFVADRRADAPAASHETSGEECGRTSGDAAWIVTDELVAQVYRKVCRFSTSSSPQMEQQRIRRILEAAAAMQAGSGA